MYKLTATGISRDSDNASIPKDSANSDYAAYLAWVAAGGIVTPADVPTTAQVTSQSLSQVRAMRASFFPILAGLQSEALARGVTADATAIAVLQQGMRDITKTDLTGLATKDVIDAKLKAAWIALVSVAPASVVAAFTGLNK